MLTIAIAVAALAGWALGLWCGKEWAIERLRRNVIRELMRTLPRRRPGE